MNKEVTPLHFIGTGPKLWQESVLEAPLGLPNAVEFAEVGNFTEWLVQEQERTWEEETGVKPEDTHLTVIMPIYNEETYLQMGLSSVMLSNIPPTADIHFAFVTNNCSDNSEHIVQSFLQSSTDVDEDFPKDQISTAIQQVDAAATVQGSGTIGNIHFTHINTTSRGKGNALTVGNELALANNHPLAFCIDANNFVAPDAFAHLYRDAHRSMVAEPDGTTVVNGFFDSEVRKEGKDKFSTLMETRKREAAPNAKHQVMGALMGWDTEWLKSVGGVPNIALEDYAVGALALHGGKKIIKTLDATTYGYSPNNVWDFVSFTARTIRGRMQIIAKYPELTEIVKADYPYLFTDFKGKVDLLLDTIKNKPNKIPQTLGLFFIRELSRQIALREYNKDPSNPMWRSIKSTK